MPGYLAIQRVHSVQYTKETKSLTVLAGQMYNLPGGTFWGFQGSCLQSLMAARDAGKLTFYDFPNAHYFFGSVRQFGKILAKQADITIFEH